MDASENDKNLSLGIRIYWIFGMDRGTALPLIIIIIIIIYYSVMRGHSPFACRALSLSVDSKNVLFFLLSNKNFSDQALQNGFLYL